MKLITLNTWGGRIKELSADFYKKYSEADVWCFQEVHHKGVIQVNVPNFEINCKFFDDVKDVLDSHAGEFCPTRNDNYGLATFVRKNISIVERGEMLVAVGDWDFSSDMHNRDHHRKIQWLEIDVNGKRVLVANVHLTHRPEGKTDSEKRLNQSKIIIDFLKMFPYPKILCGDFNLLPDTESIKMIEKAGMRNLVTEYKVESTRTKLYGKPLQFADYIFVSPEIKVNDFKVLPDVVSDHSPLFLDFEV